MASYDEKPPQPEVKVKPSEIEDLGPELPGLPLQDLWELAQEVEETGRAPVRGFDERQVKFVAELLKGRSYYRAARAAGYSHSYARHAREKIYPQVRALHELALARLKELYADVLIAALPKAAKRLVELMDSSHGSTALGAIKELLNRTLGKPAEEPEAGMIVKYIGDVIRHQQQEKEKEQDRSGLPSPN